MYKLIALDLDGTLLSSRGEVSARTRAALAAFRAQGTRLVLCTGRPPRHIKDLAEDLGLAHLVIAYNGAAIVNFDKGTVSYRHQLERSLALAVIDALKEAHPEALAGIETPHGWYLDEALYQQRLPALQARNLAPPDGHGDVRSFVRDSVIKVLFRHPELPSDVLAQSLAHLPVYATWSHKTLLEVMAGRVNKREALSYLCAEFGLEAAQVATFGDANNDKEMLAWAGCGVAVANASPEALAAADVVSASNDEDGVAAVLERWLEHGT